MAPPGRLMPYVDVPPLRTAPIQGGRTLAPTKAPAETPVVRNAQALKQARKELIAGIIKEILSMPHPMRFDDLAMVSPVARQEAIDLLKKGKWSRADGKIVGLKGALLQELEDTMKDLGQDSLVYLTTLSEIYSQVETARQERASGETKTSSRRTTVEDVPEGEEEKEEIVEVLLQDLPVPMCYESDGSGGVPRGGLIIPDAVETFLAEHSKAEVKGVVTVTKSEKIWVFFPIVNHARREECIFDEGSQVCSASEAAARILGISWDPDLTIGLQSSNRTTARTLGLARNVPMMRRSLSRAPKDTTRLLN